MRAFNLVALLSGENPALALGELRSLLLAQNQPISELKLEFERLARFRGEIDSNNIQGLTSWLVRKAALTHQVGLLLGFRRDKTVAVATDHLVEQINEIAQAIEDKNWPNFNQTFAVRFRRIGENMADVKYRRLLPRLESELGTLICDKTGSSVALDNPQCRIDGYLTSEGFILCRRLATADRRAIRERRPSKRAFFHPSAMNSILARCIVNLSLPDEEGFLVDPFAGTGGFLIEAAEMGYRSIGIEKNRGQLWGLTKNIRAHGCGLVSAILGDARFPPFRSGSLACIATDPPYGTTSSTEGVRLEALLENVFQSWKSIIRGRLVICLPTTFPLLEIAEKTGWYPIEIYYWPVHRSLTRQITVFVQNSPGQPGAIPTLEQYDPEVHLFASMKEQRKGDP